VRILVHVLRRPGVARLATVMAVSLMGLATAWSYASHGIVFTLLSGDLSAADKVALLQQFFESFGAAAPLVYLAMVTAEVVLAPLPGLMLYAPGGVVFGGFWGGLLSLAGNVLGAGIACQLMRFLGRPYLERFLQRDSLQAYESQLVRSGVWVIFLLRVNPLTSSDLVSYAAGATRMPVWKVMLGTLCGMAPLCWAQAYLADGILSVFPRLIYPLLAACALYTVGVVWALKKLAAQAAARSPLEAVELDSLN
jgi:uncharacterized membrane protein YdjX (TVP38/TMEM64 family)